MFPSSCEVVLPGIPQEKWGQELRANLTGDALKYWFRLWDVRETGRNWEALKRPMLTRLCGVAREEIISGLYEVRWKGSAVKCASDSSAVLCQGVPSQQEQQVDNILANLPDGIVLKLTNDRHVKFVT